MKTRLLILLTMVLESIIVLNAQTSKITSFYGVKFGDTRSAIEAGVRSQGKTGEWKYDKSKNMDYYYVLNPELGSIKFNSAYLYMKDGKLAMGKFSTTYSVTDHGEGSVFIENVEEDKRRYESYSQEKFDGMRYNLTSKYGEPIVNTSEKCVWRSGGNQITLQNRSYTTHSTFSGFGMTSSYPEYNYNVFVEYSSLSNAGENF